MTKDDLKVLVEDLRKQRASLEKKEKIIKERSEELTTRLERASKTTVEEAKKVLLDEVQRDIASDVAKKIRTAEERVKLESQAKAAEILADAMKHGATDYVADYTVSTVYVLSEEVKGRIIGKEG